MGDKLLLASRKSRKGDSAEDSRYARQETSATARAERDGHTVVKIVRDTISSQSLPWERKNLRAWMSEEDKLKMWDVLYVSETDRLARMDDRGWHFIEDWCYRNGKKIMTAEGVQFPPRHQGDKYQWVGLKDRARSYWEDCKSKHEGGREECRKQGGFIGKPPFGYAISGAKYKKVPVPHPEHAALAREMFKRFADGESAVTVAGWLTVALGREEKPIRAKFVLDAIRNRSYLGSRDGTEFEPLIDEKTWADANATLAARSFTRAAPAAVHGYSGCLHCGTCGNVLYRHKANRGRETYLCSAGRQGVPEEKCGQPAVSFDTVNDAVDAIMATVRFPEQIQRASGGDAGKASELLELKRKMAAALAKNDMPEVARLSVAYSERDARESEPVKVWWQQTGRTLADLWRDGDLEVRRGLVREQIKTHGYVIVVNRDETAELIEIEEDTDIRPA